MDDGSGPRKIGERRYQHSSMCWIGDVTNARSDSPRQLSDRFERAITTPRDQDLATAPRQLECKCRADAGTTSGHEH